MSEIRFRVPYWLMRLFGGGAFDADVAELTERAEMTGKAKRSRDYLRGIVSVGVEVELHDATPPTKDQDNG